MEREPSDTPALGGRQFGTSIRYVFTARRYAKRGICHRRVCVCVSVCLSHSGIVPKHYLTMSTVVARCYQQQMSAVACLYCV